jgi:hypothetical protein
MRDSSGYHSLAFSQRKHFPGRAIHLTCLFFLLLSLAALGRAQDSPGRFEAGGSFTIINSFGAGSGPFGPGMEGDVNFGRHIAFDATLNWLPRRFGLLTGGRVVQGLMGAKVGTRFQHFGLFAKVRPGFITTGSGLRSTVFDFAPPPFINNPNTFRRLTEPALDLGGVVEYYPAKHWALRYDLGNTILFEEAVKVNVIGTIPPGFVLGPLGGKTTDHFQFSTSLHYRF